MPQYREPNAANYYSALIQYRYRDGERARELGTSEDPKDFERAFEKITKKSPK